MNTDKKRAKLISLPFKRNFLWLLCLFLLLLGGKTAVFAHGGGELKISHAPIGDYKVTIWSDPPQPRAGDEIHITIGVFGEEDQAVLDAKISVQAIDADGNIVVDTVATTEQSANKLLYETDFVLETAVSHQIITTLHKDDTIGDVTFAIEVAEAKPRFSVLWIGFAALFVFLLIGLWVKSNKK